MGSNSSTHGGIAFSFENSTCIAGQVVTGTINLSVTKPSGPGTLYLRFKGVEKTHWTTRRKQGKIHYTESHGGRHKICNVSYPVYNFEHGVEVGGYSLPFSFNLPENISSSFSYESGTTQAHIKYKFFGKFIGLSNELIKGKQEVIVRHLSYSCEKTLEQKIKANFKTWCCVDKGSCEVSISYPQDTYNPSQNARFYAIVDNSQSKLSVNEVTCRFGFTLRMKDNFMGSHIVKCNLIESKAPVVMTPGQQGKSHQIEFNLDFSTVAGTLAHMFTTKNNLIECIYNNDIEAQTDGCCMCCGDYARVTSNISIVPNIVSLPVQPQIPDGWAPHFLQGVNLHFDAKNEIPLTERN
jgi:hypothetical protein